MRNREHPSAEFREALWISRCVGHAETTPLRPEDVEGLASFLHVRSLAAGEPLVRAGDEPTDVYIVRDGCLELAVRSAGRRIVIQILRPGDIDGDIQMLLGKAMPYETRAQTDTTCLMLEREAFERLLATHPQLSRRWLTSVSERLARSHSRLTNLLGQPLDVQVAQLLLEERVDDVVVLTQTTVAALLGVRRPSINRVLKRFARDGMVEVSYGRVRVLDALALAKHTAPSDTGTA
ncbi:Crp/Fnr family transcriptional regulator [Janibacter cremeus]|uniref:Crp/Fnr family transcriptional regulator n=1 Tax=Janibacter cremeus TaxID=1285192 RepID=UPI0023F77582|nr:Crp/Fnr family transcriptional regulator [Janibacter cremeus]WEV78166.1 Crp/Fnr family transcriptional regulator [Janibacter cremeus]WEV78246.1 Crp/Fnr family transcriptional regulator [Janibacter cremeus]